LTRKGIDTLGGAIVAFSQILFCLVARNGPPACPFRSIIRRMIHITVNGQPETLPDGSSVQILLEQRGLTGMRLAVECNGEIVPRARHADAPLAEGDTLEIVSAVGGG